MITGDRIFLREIKPVDLELMRLWRNAPPLRRMFREHRLISPMMQERWYERIQGDDTQSHFAVCLKGGILIGYAGLSGITRVNRVAETGWFIGDEAIRTGNSIVLTRYALDTYRTLIRYAFREAGIRKLCSEVYAVNRFTVGLHERLGFTEEGRLREHVMVDGCWSESILFGLLNYEERR